MPRKRKRRQLSPKQPDLFSAQAPAWIEANWPEYARHPGARAAPARPALVRWAETIEGLPAASRAMLITLAREAAATGSCRTAITALSRTLGIARNTCRRYLDKLTEAGLLMMKLWLDESRGSGPLGYEVRLITDQDSRLHAERHGFISARAGIPNRERARRGVL